MYDIWIASDPYPEEPPEKRRRREKRLAETQEMVHFALLDLRLVLSDPNRDEEQVYRALQPFYDLGHTAPADVNDLPLIEAFCRRVLEIGGRGQSNLQTELLRLVGNTAHPSSLPFLLEMLRYSKRGDSFGPERRLLALWGLARIARRHNLPDAYTALQTGLDDRKAEVRWQTADLLPNAYLDARREVPPEIMEKLEQMAENDPDEDVRGLIARFLKEPWADDEVDDLFT